MGFREKMRSMRDDIVKKTQESIENSKDTGRWRSVFLEDKIPEGVSTWRPKEGQHIIDILPWFTGKNHPKNKPGGLSISVDYYAHRNIGPLNDNFVCKLKTSRIPEPICDYIKRNKPGDEEYKRIKPVRMGAYLVWVHDTPEEEKKGVQIFDIAHFLFQQKIDAQAKHPRGGAPVPYADIEEGKSIYFEIVKSGKWVDSTGKEREGTIHQGHKFIDREEPLPDHIIDSVFPLDEAMDLNPSDEDINASFYGEPKEGEEGEGHEEGPPEIPEEFKREPYQGRDETRSASPPPPPKEPKPDFKTLDAKGWKDHWKKYPEDQPAMLAYQESLKAPPPAAASSKEAESGKCPAGGQFGADNEKLPECRKCGVWDDCAALLDSGGAASAAPSSKETPPSSPTGLRRRR